MDFTLSEEEKRLLLEAARASIASRFSGEPAKRPRPTGALAVPCGAFVTLRKGESLRGCIGYVTAAKPLLETVREVACASAFDDPRFPPLGPEELASLKLEISVLSPLEKITDVGLIKVGVHGIMIKRGFRSGLLLPQVAEEQHWDRETFLTHTCYKAGLPSDAWKSPDAVIEIFSALVFHE